MSEVPLLEEVPGEAQGSLMLGRKLEVGSEQGRPGLGEYWLDPELLGLVPKDLMLRYRCLALAQKPEGLVVGMVNPHDLMVLDDIGLITGFDILPVAITDSEFVSVTHWLLGGGPAPVATDCVLSMTGLQVRGRIAGPLAQVQVRQTFQNPFPEALEAIYLFPLSPRAAVYQFRMQVGERVIEGQIQEKGEARQTYEEGRSQGHRVGLLEQRRGNVFATTVGNIAPGETVHLDLSYVERLEMDETDTIFRLPLVVSPRYFPKDLADPDLPQPPLLPPGLRAPSAFSLELEVEHGGVGLSHLGSTQHTVETRMDERRTRVELAREDELLNRDFVLRFRLGRDASNLLLTHSDTFLLCLTPPAVTPTQAPARDLVVILDRSGSMGGAKMESACRAVLKFLDTVGAQDRFAIVAFDDRLEFFRSGFLQPASELPHARKWLETLASRGGTEILGPIRWLVDLSRSHDSQRHLSALLITDGQVGNEAQIYAYFQKENPGVRLHTLGVDSAVNEAFLRQVARIGRGTCELITPGERLERALERLSREVGYPLMCDVEISNAGLNPREIWPDPIPDLYAGRPVVLLGRFQGAGDLIVRGMQGSQELVARISPQPIDNPALPLLWAKEKIRTLQDRLILKDSVVAEEVAREVTVLALQYGLVSDYTSFVLVDREQVVNPEGHCQTVLQPLELPDQWDDGLDCTVKDISAQDFGNFDFEDEKAELEQLRHLIQEAPIVRVVQLIIGQGIQDRAERIVIRPEAQTVVVEFEVDGQLHEVMTPPRHVYAAVLGRIKFLAGLDLCLHDTPQSARMDWQHDLRDYRLDVVIQPSDQGDCVEISVEPQQLKAVEIEPIPHDLGETLKAALTRPGMLLLVGSGQISWRLLAGILLQHAGPRPAALYCGRPRPQVEGLLSWEPGLESELVGFTDLADSDWELVGRAAESGPVLVLSERPGPVVASLGHIGLEWLATPCGCSSGCDTCRYSKYLERRLASSVVIEAVR